jgi:hypothetical protein
VVFALASACYSTGGGRSNGTGGNAGSSGKGGTTGAVGGSPGAGGAGARGGTPGQGATSSSGGSAGSGGTDNGMAGAGGGGTGGSSASSGSSGTAGSSGNGAGRLGQACVTDAECGTTGLTCLENDEISGSGPPKGLCTTPCTSDTVCSELAPGAFCIEFPDGEGYCIESCTLGINGEPKCNEREEFGCGIVGVTPGSRACVDSAECTSGQLCVDGVCNDAVTACIPVCGGDYNCGAGQYCDFASGFCVTGEAQGLPIGASCDPTAEEDPCQGFCVQVSDTEGMCSADCTANTSGNGCGFNGTTDAEAVCVWVPVYADPADVGVGDNLFCGAMCDCNDECAIEGWACFAADPILGTGAGDFFGRAGLCAPMSETETVDDTLGACPDTGAGGAGGAPSSGGVGGDALGGQSGSDSGGEAGQAVQGGAGAGGVNSEI